MDEYVFALRAAKDARDGFRWLDALEQYAESAEDLPEIAWTALQQIASGLPVQWDRHSKRASALADQLMLTPRGRKAGSVASKQDAKPPDPFDELDAEDEVAKKREGRAQAS